MSRSVAFYRDILGLSCLMESQWWSEFQVGGGKLALHHALEGSSPPFGQAGKGWFLAIETDDVSALKKHLQAHDAVITEDFHEVPSGVVLTFADPDGNPLQAIQLGLKIGSIS